MERLTTRYNGHAVMAWEYEEKYTTSEWIDMLTDRLAAYEDTGLEPEEINSVFIHSVIEENKRLKELAQAEKDGRMVVRGQWNENGSGIIICSECEHGYNLIGRYTHYCPNCGAKMDLSEAALKKREEDT